MDVNGLKFWSLSRMDEWFRAGQKNENLQWCSDERVLRLAAQNVAPQLFVSATKAAKLRILPAPIVDRGGNTARWNDATKALELLNRKSSAAPLLRGGTQPTDLAFGVDDIVYVARDGHVELHDTRQRFDPQTISLNGFGPVKLAAAPGGGVFALDTAKGLVARLVGEPLQKDLFPPTPTSQFAPATENPNPPRLEVLAGPALKHAATIAASLQGRIAVLCTDDINDAQLVVVDEDSSSIVMTLTGMKTAVSLAWNGASEIAVLATDGESLAASAFVYTVNDGGPSLPNGRIYPLVEAEPLPFINTPSPQPLYVSAGGKPLALVPVSSVTFARSGYVEITIDSGVSDTVWHRMYLEANIPVGCQVNAGVIAANMNPPIGTYAPHYFGGVKVEKMPQAAWLDEASELPHHQGLLRKERKQDCSGLFSVLIQRDKGNIRSMAGRYLKLKLELTGNSQATPEIAGLRLYASRFSYRDQYLPRLYREQAEPDTENKKATGSDFLDRFLGSLEEPFTILEGKIAQSDLLTRAGATPAAALPWLAQWLGVDMPAGEGSRKDREILKAAPFTARMHGTLGGLRAALELETGGVFIENPRFDRSETTPQRGEFALVAAGGKEDRALVLSPGAGRSGGPAAVLVGGKVTRGAIVVLEGFRLRRTFSTILGAHLADEEDELTGGLAISGNSFVGDTLFLGSEFNPDVLALFSDVPDAADQDSVLEFFDQLAFRTTVLVHEDATPSELMRLQRVAQAESPAHVDVNVVKARYPFLVGAGTLLGVDTFLTLRQPRAKFILNASQIGMGDMTQNPGLLTHTTTGQLT